MRLTEAEARRERNRRWRERKEEELHPKVVMVEEEESSLSLSSQLSRYQVRFLLSIQLIIVRAFRIPCVGINNEVGSPNFEYFYHG